ncbi:MAG: hypothetical protein ABW110_12390 [Steroidobacteraceae bacterium]
MTANYWGRTKLDEGTNGVPQVWPLTPKLAMLTTSWTRYSPAGEVVTAGRSFYWLRHSEDAWRIIGLVYNY